MMSRLVLSTSVAVLMACAPVAAAAATLFDFEGATSEMQTDMFLPVAFGALGGEGLVSFIIDGYDSLDGDNLYKDDFILRLNDVEIFRGAFNLGGGGKDRIFRQPVGATWSNVSGNFTNITWAGGRVMLTVPLALAHGANTLAFGYASMTGPRLAGFQGVDDEGWGLENIRVTGDALTVVPEPASWALLVLGFGGLGAMLRRRGARPGVTGA